MTKYKISFLGSGNMAGAIGRGLKAANSNFDLCFYDIHADKSAELAGEAGGINKETIKEAVAYGDMLLFAVKPQVMADVLAEIKDMVRDEQLLLTIAAGLPISFYEEKFPNNPVVRVMPNTSAAVLKSMSGLMAGAKAGEEHKAVAEEIFAAIGDALWISEDDIHAFIAISGSAPAYFYYFVDTMIKAGVELGLSPEVAERLARKTAAGAGAMLEVRPESAETLCVQVCSPKGTTIEAIDVFAAAQPELTLKAMTACCNRSKEMAKA